jgi:hypothetical protein
MIGKIPVGRARLAAVAVGIAVAAMTMVASVAIASPTKVVYSNFNTVPTLVNGLPNQDTYSAAPFEFPFGGLVQFSARPGVLKSLTTEIDSFTCEHGTYNLENCYTGNPNKKFLYVLDAKIYEVNAENEKGALVATSIAKFKIPYRPTTNVSCPSTIEGKGFGKNCDVGGYLDTITFKKFTPTSVLPEKAIITVESTAGDPRSDVVNVGTQTSYKAFENEEFVAEGPAEGGKPSVGEDPLPEETFIRGKLAGGQAGFQPVFQVTAKA